jgi:hypothetical protein
MHENAELSTSEHSIRNAEGPTLPGPDWTQLPAEDLPQPTYWPAVLALSIILMLWGIVTTFIISAVGFILFAIALSGWIGELRRGA